MIIDILTLFPEMFQNVLSTSIIGRAVENDLVKIKYTNIRDFSNDKHNRVDDYSFGGGPGMVMKPEPIYESINSVKKENSRIIYLSPKGKLYNQKIAIELSKEQHIVLLCGHYEGIDNRIIENYISDEISIGDYVLTGGEIAAMVVIDSVVRLMPGVLGKEESYIEESHYSGLLEYPQYTRPRAFNGYQVPEILLSGDHNKIKKWRQIEALRSTFINRPDMIKIRNLTDEENKILDTIKL